MPSSHLLRSTRNLGMENRLGFVLATHQNPRQILNLVKTLVLLFDNPRITIHHDQSQSCLSIPTEFGTRVQLVRNYEKTSWGKFSVIDGTIKAMRLMANKWGLPEWVFLMSESCYPIKPASSFFEHLAETKYDVHMKYERIEVNSFREGDETVGTAWQMHCHKRYDVANALSPFNTLFPCYAGEHWFHAKADAVNYLINYHERNSLLAQYYKGLEAQAVICPDESYYHTILANNCNLKVSTDHHRFIEWTDWGDHPEVLTLKDLPKLRKSSALIARKFDLAQESAVFHEIDKIINLHA